MPVSRQDIAFLSEMQLGVMSLFCDSPFPIPQCPMSNQVKHKVWPRLEGKIIAMFPTNPPQFQIDWGKGIVSTESEDSVIFIESVPNA